MVIIIFSNEAFSLFNAFRVLGVYSIFIFFRYHYLGSGFYSVRILYFVLVFLVDVNPETEIAEIFTRK